MQVLVDSLLYTITFTLTAFPMSCLIKGTSHTIDTIKNYIQNRCEVYEKRITEAYFLYTYLELSQVYSDLPSVK